MTSARLLLAATIGLTAGAIIYLGWADTPTVGVSDWDQVYHGARALLQGENPYHALSPEMSPWPLLYPLPAVFLALPFAGLPVHLARALWFGVSAGVLAYAWGVRPLYRLTGLVSGAMLWAAFCANWTPFLVAGLWLPAVALFWAIKPHTGLLLWVRQPSRGPIVAGLALAVLSSLLIPTWPIDWVRAVLDPAWGYAYHPIPVTLPGGFLLLLALLRWREPRAQMVAAYALLPTSAMPNELLLGYAVARTRGEWLVYTATTWAVTGYVWFVVGPAAPGESFEGWALRIWPAILGGWLVALGIVLRRR